MKDMKENWQPPVRFFAAGRQRVDSREYHYECREMRPIVRRLLIKHTVSGEGVIYTSQQRHRLVPGSVFMIQRPGPYVYCYEADGTPWAFEYLSMILPSTGDWLPASIQQNPVWHPGESSPISTQISSVIDQVLEHKRHSGLSQGFTILNNQSISQSAAAYRLYLSCIADCLHPQQQLPTAAVKLRDYLHNHFSSEIHLSSLCNKIGYTPEALSRLFRKTFGLSPQQYLIRIRLEHAQSLLQQTGRPLKQIAHECGFESLNYFCRVFRKHCDIPPGQYRRNPDPLNQIR